MATLRRRSSMPASSTASSTICRASAALALRLAALHEVADAVDDLAGPFGLACGLLQRGHEVVLLDRLGLHAADHAVAVVGDGRQRLVQLVRHRRRHLAHRHQPARDLRLLGLQRRLLLGTQPRGDVGGDQHLRQPAVGPLQVARAHVEPLLQRLDEDLARAGAGFHQLFGRQAREVVDVVVASARAGTRHPSRRRPACRGRARRRRTTGGSCGSRTAVRPAAPTAPRPRRPGLRARW